MMDSWTLNKIAGAVLGTCVVGMGVGIIAQGVYEPGAPAKPGYALPEPKETASASAEKKPEIVPIAVRMETANSQKGEADAKVCSACHNFQEGAGAKVGPGLWNVVDRPKGKAEGFDYSAGLKAKGGDWSYTDLDQFLTKPSAYIQGTKMGYPGQDDPEKRADIIAYLRTLSKDPKPLPKVRAEDKKVASADAKDGAGKDGGASKTAGKGSGAGEAAGEAAFLTMVGEADPKKGQSAAQVCSACHNFKKGAGALIGPGLWDVVDRKKGSVAGYEYSAGLKAKGGEWTLDDLNAWLTNPQQYIPGTKMGYAGEASQKKRAEIIAFLRTLSDHPVAVPNGKVGEDKAKTVLPGEAPNMSVAAKPGDARPPHPPSGSAPKPEASSAADAPKTPDAVATPGRPTTPPTHDNAEPPVQKSDTPAAKPEQKTEATPSAPSNAPAHAKAAEAAPTAAEPISADAAGPEPYQSADPSYPNPAATEPTIASDKLAPATLTSADDMSKASAGGPEPYAAPTPGEAK